MDYHKDFEDGVAETKLGRLHYKYHKGIGATLVFLHGMGGTTMVWGKLMEEMPGDLNIYLIDLLGHGESDAPHIDYTIEGQVSTLKEFAEKLQLNSFYLIGHSYGGWIATYYASQYDLAGLVIVDGAGLKAAFDQIRLGHREDHYKSAFFKSTMMFAGNHDYVINSILDQDLKESSELDDDILAKVRAPTLIIWGTKDPILSPQIGFMLNVKIKSSVFQPIDGAEHNPHHSHPKEFAAAVLRFIEETSKNKRVEEGR